VAPVSPADAAARARAALGLAHDVCFEAHRVRRLDGGEEYWLVSFGEPEATLGVAAVAAGSGEVLSSALLPGRGPHLAVSGERARALARAPAAATVELAWRPSPASRSPLSPFWEVEGAAGRAWVDVRGKLWRTPPWEAETRG